MMRVDELPAACFQGVVPALLATCSRDGMPNATWLSQVFLVDARHLALSCQFFRKTRENLADDPRAQLWLVDSKSFREWRLDVRFARQETSGPVFEAMSKRIHAVASLSNLEQVFALKSADIFEVMMISEVESSRARDLPAPRQPVDPLQALARIGDGVARSRGLESLVQTGIELLKQHLGLETVSLYVADPNDQSLFALASLGYPNSGVGARVGYGIGVVGTAAEQRMPVRIADTSRERRYAGAVREQLERVSGVLEREVPLPGLQDASSQLAVPMLVDGELFGVLSSESARVLAFDERDEQALQVAGAMFAQALARALERAKEVEEEPGPTTVQSATAASSGSLHVRYYQADDSVFLDGEYLIKGLPGRILWLLLTMRQSENRDTFLNRELRLHPVLKLPGYKDNLEARLLMLQRRLQDKTTSLRMYREQRGRLRLCCDQRVVLEHRAG